MPPKSAKSQTSLANWIKRKSDVHEDAVNAAVTDDDDGEGRTLPPPSEPDSDIEGDEERPEPGPSDISKGKGKKKLILAPTTKSGAKKPRASKSTGSEPKKRSSQKEKASKASTKKATTSKAKGKQKDDSEEEEVEDDDEGNQSDDADMLNKAKTHPDDLRLAPLSQIPAIFKDIVTRNPKLGDVADLFQKHTDSAGARRKLRVGTMCSGTESPLLALQLISEAMEMDKKMNGRKLEVEHIFSCEIEPFKQAYIERNFRPPILFRDVTELGGTEA
ncbi:hypothetical protein FRB91_006810 [Serendipita sp. 411]|nr:hypothetical protein FRB91_006810 [Serendipita sp. 411]